MSALHDNHCFVAMPFGRSDEEVTWYTGWYRQAIEPAIVKTGFLPLIAVATESPVDITDEIREHLACDPMVIVDLGGATSVDEPNPNVMYELGIRHALGLPLVLLAWRNQRLPFDVNHQRVIMADRKMLYLDEVREKLCKFIESAMKGEFYRPMDVVKRSEQLRAAAKEQGEPLLADIANELRDIRGALAELKPSLDGDQLTDREQTVEVISQLEPLTIRRRTRR